MASYSHDPQELATLFSLFLWRLVRLQCFFCWGLAGLLCTRRPHHNHRPGFPSGKPSLQGRIFLLWGFFRPSSELAHQDLTSRGCLWFHQGPGSILSQNSLSPVRGSGGSARSGERADLRGVRGFALFPESAHHSCGSTASPVRRGWAREWLRVANPDATQLRPRRCTWGRRQREETPAAGRGLCPSAAPPRPASRLPAPSAVPLPRRGRRERAGQRGVKPTRLRRGGIRRRAELGAEAASAKKKCPPEETHKFYRGDRQPARGATGGQALEPPEPRGPKRSRGPEATEPPAAWRVCGGEAWARAPGQSEL